MSKLYCQSCGEDVPLGSHFCKHCRFPFTKEAEAKLLQIKNKPRPKIVEPDPEDEETEEEDENDTPQTSSASLNELGGLEIEGLYQDKPQKISFERLIKSPKETGFQPRKPQKLSKKAFEKQWQAEAGNSRRADTEE